MLEQRLANVGTDLEYHQWEFEPLGNTSSYSTKCYLFHLNMDSALPVIDPSAHFDSSAIASL
jgi:hypothetical protein